MEDDLHELKGKFDLRRAAFSSAMDGAALDVERPEKLLQQRADLSARLATRVEARDAVRAQRAQHVQRTQASCTHGGTCKPKITIHKSIHAPNSPWPTHAHVQSTLQTSS